MKPLGWKSVGKMVCESFLKGGLRGILDEKLFRAVAAGKKCYSGAGKSSLIDSP